MVEVTFKKEGFLFYYHHVDPDEEGIFYLFEGWESQAAHDIHGQTAHVKALVADAPG